MELFTEVEFDKNEFDKINNVLLTLEEDGWEEYHKEKFYKEKKHQTDEAILVAIKYKFIRHI